jgi:glutathione S-transferase
MDVDVGPVADALDPYHRRYRHGRRETLGDMAGRRDPYARERMRGEIGAVTIGLGAAVEQMAILTPMLRRSLEDSIRRMDDAIARGRYARPYDRGYDSAITIPATTSATIRATTRTATTRNTSRAKPSSRTIRGLAVAESLRAMWQLYQFPLCPFSRKVRLMLAEKGVAHELVRESPWLKRDEFTDLNPAGQTPVLVEDPRGHRADRFEGDLRIFRGDGRPLADDPGHRAQPRRGPAAGRLVRRGSTRGGRAADGGADAQAPGQPRPARHALLREAMKTANGHLDYIDYLLDHRRWLAGPVLSLADLTAAAHLSVADYLGGIDWRGHKQTADWYAVMKSRPSFRPLLGERMEVIAPPPHYDKVDF